MQRTTCRIIILTMIIVLLSFTTILGEDRKDITLQINTKESNEKAKSLCWIGEKLYILGSHGIYTWSENGQLDLYHDLSYCSEYVNYEEEPINREESILWQKAIHNITTDGRSLLGIHSYTGVVSCINESGSIEVGCIPRELIYSEAIEANREILQVGYWNNQLIVLLGTDDYADYEKTELYSINLDSKDYALIGLNGIMSFTPSAHGLMIQSSDYPDGVVLYKPGESNYDISIIPIIGGSQLKGLCWNKREGRYVYTSKGIIRTIDEELRELDRSYIPVFDGYVDLNASCSDNGLFAAAYGKYVFVRDTNGTKPTEQTVLHVSGTLNPELLIEFTLDNPHIAVLTIDGDYTAQNAVLTGDEKIDVFVLSTPGDYSSMKEKGYLAEINSEELREWVDALYPEIQRVVKNQDSLVSVPININVESWSVNENLWDQFSLTDYPETYDELLSNTEKWQSDYAINYPEYTYSDIKQNGLEILIKMIVKDYIFQTEMSQASLVFSTDSFRETMELVLAHADILKNGNMSWEIPIISSYSQGFGISVNDGDRVRMILPPTINAYFEQYLFTELEMLAVSKKSNNKNAAEQFITWYTHHLESTTEYKMNPQLNTPIENPNYAPRLLKLNDELDTLLQLQMVANDPSEFDETISKKRRQIEACTANRWSVSQESIDCYRNLANRIKIPDQSVFFSSLALNNIYEVVSRYCEKGFNSSQLAAFISELDRVAYMVMMEIQ